MGRSQWGYYCTPFTNTAIVENKNWDPVVPKYFPPNGVNILRQTNKQTNLSRQNLFIIKITICNYYLAAHKNHRNGSYFTYALPNKYYHSEPRAFLKKWQKNVNPPHVSRKEGEVRGTQSHHSKALVGEHQLSTTIVSWSWVKLQAVKGGRFSIWQPSFDHL